MTAAAKKVRMAAVGGTEHTDASLEAMKTGEIAALVASIRAGKPPKPATKAKAIELFWNAAEGLPKTPAVPDSKADALEATTETTGTEKARRGRRWRCGRRLEATTETTGTEKAAPEKAPKVKRYAIRADGPEQAAKIAAMNPVARRLAEEIRDAGRPLSMAECAAIVTKFSKSRRPDKLVAWHFCQLYRPAGILVESRDGRGA